MRRWETVTSYQIESESNDAGKAYSVHTNPKKPEKVVFTPEDKVIVMAEE